MLRKARFKEHETSRRKYIIKREVLKMEFKEIDRFDIINLPYKVQTIITDNANHFNNMLYILNDGNHFIQEMPLIL